MIHENRIWQFITLDKTASWYITAFLQGLLNQTSHKQETKPWDDHLSLPMYLLHILSTGLQTLYTFLSSFLFSYGAFYASTQKFYSDSLDIDVFYHCDFSILFN
jgi:hypothetical protein